VTNLTYAIGSFSRKVITSSNGVIVTVCYKQPSDDIAHNTGPKNGGYGGAIVPLVSVPMTCSSPMYGSPMYGSEPYGTIETPNSESNGHKAKAHLSKHKHHTTKHHKTGKNHSK
jgi:hypothetical protein